MLWVSGSGGNPDLEKTGFERWLGLMERLDLPPAQTTFEELARAYSAASRHYHNAAHIAHCLAELDAAAAQVPDADALELALWFHDAVYDSRSASNETGSARWAADFLAASQAPRELRAEVVALILATRHQPGHLSPAQRWMVDIDLAILGSDRPRFSVYEQAIRQEYIWVPDPIFREKRVALLRDFLDRPVLYVTDHFRAQYEAQARLNLAWAIGELEGFPMIDRRAARPPTSATQKV